MGKLTNFNFFSYNYLKDFFALIISTIMISFGIIMLKQVGVLIGSSVGIAFLISYCTSFSFSFIFFLINIPFFLLAIYKMGLEFTIKTFFSVGLVSFFTNVHKFFIHFVILNPFYTALIANIIIGIGFIILFKHKSSLGGINILALFLQNYLGINIGKFQTIIDICVLLMSVFIVSLPMLVISIIGSIILNLIITINYRTKQYISD